MPQVRVYNPGAGGGVVGKVVPAEGRRKRKKDSPSGIFWAGELPGYCKCCIARGSGGPASLASP